MCRKQVPYCKTYSCFAIQEIPRVYINSNCHYSAHTNPLLAYILTKMYLAQAIKLYFLNIHFNIILPSTSSQSLSFGLTAKILFEHFYYISTL
jgi:hypothetical protein